MMHIKTGTPTEVVSISHQIPELKNPYPESEYIKRIKGKPYLILIAMIDTEPVGFKVGYQKAEGGPFYSWMGGVKPEYRRRGIAYALAKEQEKWAEANGFEKIQFKTRNRLKAMQIFGLRNGFDLIRLIPKEDINEYRLVFEKTLKKSP